MYHNVFGCRALIVLLRSPVSQLPSCSMLKRSSVWILLFPSTQALGFAGFFCQRRESAGGMKYTNYISDC